MGKQAQALVARDREQIRYRILDTRKFVPRAGQTDEGVLQNIVGIRARLQANEQVMV